MLHLLLALPPTSSPLPPPSHPPLTVLITGATGRTGSLLYLSLSPLPHLTVRALVSNRTKASAVLGCGACLPSDGVWEGDVTSPSSLIAPMAGVDVVAIAVGVRGGPMQSSQIARLVEFVGVQNQVAALMAGGGGRGRRAKRVILCSSMGTTDPKGAVGGGDVLFYKLNAEAFLGASGVGSTIVKPCGLVDRPGGQHSLAVAHDDKLPTPDFTIARADVAAVMAEAVLNESSTGLRFLLCNGRHEDPPTKNLGELLHQARWPWERD